MNQIFLRTFDEFLGILWFRLVLSEWEQILAFLSMKNRFLGRHGFHIFIGILCIDES